ncbi:hypothetical protein TrispH2_011548 [Trichoplax sp. H2]|nr:hypothetical protein TrispH2_011548 [Trichoplax sp. H2]|eukprot:RDD36523.1 hypothetical protein TrispH2_011548 [Trichoplax sp. H2]
MKFTLILLASLLFLAIAGRAEEEEPTIIEELKDEAPVEDEEGEVAEKEDEIESLENEFQVKEEDEQPEETKAANSRRRHPWQDNRYWFDYRSQNSWTRRRRRFRYNRRRFSGKKARILNSFFK